GVVSPRRTASRYRLYGDDDVARLRRMAELVADGTPASLAAEQVVAESPPAPEAETSAGPAERGPSANGHAGPDGAGDLGWTPAALPTSALPPVDALAEAARDLDRAALERVLDRAMAAGSFETVFDEWLTPALVRGGEGRASQAV